METDLPQEINRVYLHSVGILVEHFLEGNVILMEHFLEGNDLLRHQLNKIPPSTYDGDLPFL